MLYIIIFNPFEQIQFCINSDASKISLHRSAQADYLV